MTKVLLDLETGNIYFAEATLSSRYLMGQFGGVPFIRWHDLGLKKPDKTLEYVLKIQDPDELNKNRILIQLKKAVRTFKNLSQLDGK